MPCPFDDEENAWPPPDEEVSADSPLVLPLEPVLIKFLRASRAVPSPEVSPELDSLVPWPLDDEAIDPVPGPPVESVDVDSPLLEDPVLEEPISVDAPLVELLEVPPALPVELTAEPEFEPVPNPLVLPEPDV